MCKLFAAHMDARGVPGGPQTTTPVTMALSETGRYFCEVTLQRKNYSQLARPVGAYVHAVEANGMLYLSGLTAFGMPEQGQGLAAEARAVFTQIGLIAEAEGTSLASLVKVTIFVTSLDDLSALRAALFEIYGENLPASSLVKVEGLFSPKIHIEVEAVLSLGE
jgi:2-iminobutanoate/2-iminopropanoate deaminase